jgi:hypothetical protein
LDGGKNAERGCYTNRFMKENILSEWPVAQNLLFVLFVLCFLACMQFVGNSSRLFTSMLHRLFRNQERQSFSQTVNNEFLIKLTLCLQTILMASILIYCIFSHTMNLPFETTSQLVRTLGGTAGIILLFVLYKFLTNNGVGLVFFQWESMQLWNNLSFSIVSLSGMVLFFPALLIFYFPDTYYIYAILALLYFLFIEILTFYKIYKIFFHRKSSLLYFILYLCAQELLPLFCVYKTLAYFYKT